MNRAREPWEAGFAAFHWTPDPYDARDESRTAEQQAYLEPHPDEPYDEPGPDDLRDGWTP